MKLHKGDHKGDQLFHAMCRGTAETTVKLLSFTQHNTEAAHVPNGIPCTLADELGIY